MRLTRLVLAKRGELARVQREIKSRVNTLRALEGIQTQLEKSIGLARSELEEDINRANEADQGNPRWV